MHRLGVVLAVVAALVLAGCGQERPAAPAPGTAPPTQYEIIGKHVPQVLFREHLSDQGVRFGMNYVPEKHLHFVLIDPGFSRLTARQILDRLLGII